MARSPVPSTAPQPAATPRPLDLIRKKRDNGELSPDEIQFLVRAYTQDEIPDYQMAAWLMAVLIRGMTGHQLSALTGAMLHSGEVLDLSDLPGAKIDKHSTGGVGDKTSLIIAPGNKYGSTLRFTNDGARIFRRCGVPPPRLLI